MRLSDWPGKHTCTFIYIHNTYTVQLLFTVFSPHVLNWYKRRHRGNWSLCCEYSGELVSVPIRPSQWTANTLNWIKLYSRFFVCGLKETFCTKKGAFCTSEYSCMNCNKCIRKHYYKRPCALEQCIFLACVSAWLQQSECSPSCTAAVYSLCCRYAWGDMNSIMLL